jgi:predicted amidophosphoribosyltransferase
MKIKITERCMSCKKVISRKRYYCFDCFKAVEESCRIAEEQGDADFATEQVGEEE